MRNISASLTEPHILDESKTETRRLGWWFLERGDTLCVVRKGMGLKKGEKVVRLKTIIVLSTYPEKLKDITQDAVRREGFPDKTPEWFIDFFCRSHKGCTPETVVNVIKFKYYKEQ